MSGSPTDENLTWVRVGPIDLLENGRVTIVQAGHSAVSLSRTETGYGAISNRCPQAGDGGLGQYMAEFTTAVKYNMNITLILLNNSKLAKISREQRGGNYHVWQTSLHNPNFSDYANNCGGFGIRQGPSIVEIMSSADQI